jgi:twitching motility protein PilT
MNVEILFKLIDEVIASKISDIHFSSGSSPSIRTHQGEIEYIGKVPPLEMIDIENLITQMYSIEAYHHFFQQQDTDTSYERGDARFRVNIFRESNGLSLAMRLIVEKVPNPESLLIPKELLACCEKESGLILITGPTGSGKSTTLASLIEYINLRQKRHIITIEDPIEYTFQSKLSLIRQRQVGIHTQSFLSAIKSSLREDPDIIVVGEMRDAETIQAAITLAETGHLVFSTLHTNDAVQTIDRILDTFSPASQIQIRTQLAQSLKAVVSQILVPHVSGVGRIVAREILYNTDAIRNIIIR